MTERRRGQWPVAALNGAVGLTVLILVGVLALVVNPPAPPGIAAFAPQASKPITKAPLSQSSNAGEGEGQCVPGQPCDTANTTTTTTSPKLLRTGVPSSLQCFRWPDGTVTQTFDPQSPPCIAGWDDAKGNGGATATGVTATEIKIALPQSTGITIWPGAKPLVDFFNTRYQFYGRKITIVPFGSQQGTANGTGTGLNDPEAQRADAAAVTQLGVFGSMEFVDPISYSWTLPAFRDVLTRNKILSFSGAEITPYGTAAGLAAHAPYEWSYYQTLDQTLAATGSMICQKLAGKPAIHAGDGDLKSVKRKFAVLIPSDALLGGPLVGLQTMLNKLATCGVNNPRVVRFSLGNDQIFPIQAAMQDLKQDGVTSVIYFPFTGSQTSANPMDRAGAAGFRPEWVMVGWNNYLTASQLNSPPGQTQAAFGVGAWNKQSALELEPFYRAFIAAGGEPTFINSGGLPGGRGYYQDLMLIAAGIQMAGPKLTPETFAAGLQATKFPNPGAGAAPFYQGNVGFGPGATTMVRDYSAFWLDNRMSGKDVAKAPNVNESTAMCYVGLGRRWLTDAWPTADDFYAGACR